MAQRRQVLDTGFLPNVITGTLSEFQKRREQRYKLEQLFEAALASKRAEAMFPSAEEQAKQVVLERAMNAGRVPQPLGGYNPQERAEEAARGRELEFLKYILPRGQGYGNGVNVFAFNPATGEVEPAPGGTKLPTGSRILPTRVTPEEAEEVSGARTRGTTEAKEAVEFKSVKAAFDTTFSLLQNIPAPETQVGGFSLSQARKKLTQLGFDQDLNEYNTFVKSIAGQLAKVISREGGRLTDQDIQRVAGILEQLPFLPESGRVKRLRTLNTILANKGFDPVFPEAGVLDVKAEGNGTVAMTDGRRTYHIPMDRIEEAEADGLRRVR